MEFQLKEAPAAALAHEIAYPMVYESTVTPLRLAYGATVRGHRTPDLNGAFTYVDLSCGGGVISVLLADMYPKARFIAVQPNAEAADWARDLAQRAGVSNLEIIQKPATSEALADLPRADFMVMSRLYNWLKPEERADLRKLVADKLSDNGLFAMMYDTYPGGMAYGSVARILGDLAGDVEGDAKQKLEKAFAALAMMARDKLPTIENNQTLQRDIATLHGWDPEMLLHELAIQGQRGTPMFFGDVTAEFADTGLNYIGPGVLQRNYPGLVVPKDLIALFTHFTGRVAQEHMLDFIINARQRIDVYARPESRLEPAEAEERWSAFLIAGPTAEDAARINKDFEDRALRGEGGNPALTSACINTLQERSMTIAELLAAPDVASLEKSAVQNAVMHLIALRYVTLVSAPMVSQEAGKGSDAYDFTSQASRACFESTLLGQFPAVVGAPVVGGPFMLQKTDSIALYDTLGGNIGPLSKQVKDGRLHIANKEGKEVKTIDELRLVLNDLRTEAQQKLVPLLVRHGVLKRV